MQMTEYMQENAVKDNKTIIVKYNMIKPSVIQRWKLRSKTQRFSSFTNNIGDIMKQSE